MCKFTCKVRTSLIKISYLMHTQQSHRVIMNGRGDGAAVQMLQERRSTIKVPANSNTFDLLKVQSHCREAKGKSWKSQRILYPC